MWVFIVKIMKKEIENISVLAISGRIDSISSNELETAINQSLETNSIMILDLADADYISSSGLRVLLAELKLLKTKNGDLKLISLQPIVRDIFEITGLSRLFSIHNNLEDALNNLIQDQ
jgi:anti-sigma B factor antagonist